MTRQGFLLTSDSSAGGDDDLVLGRFTFLVPLRFHLFHDIHAFDNFSENYVSPTSSHRKSADTSQW